MFERREEECRFKARIWFRPTDQLTTAHLDLQVGELADCQKRDPHTVERVGGC